MNASESMLFVGAEPLGRRLERDLGGGTVHRVSDPYDGLMEMGRRVWSAVVLEAEGSEFAGMCRAARRLQRDSRLVAVCEPVGEIDVRPLVGEALDDYYLSPLTSADLADLRRSALSPEARTGPRAAALRPGAYAELIASARTLSGLEASLARMVGELIGRPAMWMDVAQASPGATPLLLAACEPPRALAASDAFEPDAECSAVLAALRGVLPALVETAERTETLRRLAITDHLTGAYNRRYFYLITDQILSRAADSFRATLLLYDIDDFKRYNEEYGHAVGDEILREITALIRRTCRAHDVVARIGGDEFTVLLWDARPRSPGSKPLETMAVLVDRLRRTVREHTFPCLSPEAKGVLSISGGMAHFPDGGRTCRQLLRTADEGLRQAKRSGKDQIRIVGTDVNS